MQTLFLDVDGVLRDFVQGVIDLYDLDITHDDVDSWGYFTKTLKIPRFWEMCDYRFWVNLPMTPYAKEVLDLVDGYNTVLLTSPTLTSAGPTQEWIKNNLSDYFWNKRYLIGPAKWACSNEHSALVDDSDSNIEAFKKLGGYDILFPSPWNKARGINPIEALKHGLKDWDLTYRGYK